MKAAQFTYQRPASLQQALQELDTATNAKAIAGSQSLGPMLNMRLTRPNRVIDVSKLAELQGVHRDTAGLTIGAAVTHAQIEDGRHQPLVGHPLQSVARDIAYRAVRNRGTLGGSLAHADPAADWVVVLSALDAQINIASIQARRSVSIDRFLLGAYTTDLASNELILSVTIPDAAPDLCWGYVKFCRKPGEFAHASAAVRFEGSTRTARIVLGALDGPPVQLMKLAAAVSRGERHASARQHLIETVRTVIDGPDPTAAKLHAVAVERALFQAGVVTGEIA